MYLLTVCNLCAHLVLGNHQVIGDGLLLRLIISRHVGSVSANSRVTFSPRVSVRLRTDHAALHTGPPDSGRQLTISRSRPLPKTHSAVKIVHFQLGALTDG